MKKMTWAEIKEKGKEFYQKNKDICLVVGGFVGGIVINVAFERHFKKEPHIEKKEIHFDTSDNKNLKITASEFDIFGKLMHSLDFSVDSSSARYLANAIVYDLSSEAK